MTPMKTTTMRGCAAALLMVAGTMVGGLATPGYAQTTEPPDLRTIGRVLEQPLSPTAQSASPTDADSPDTATAQSTTTDNGTIASRERALVLRYRRLQDRAARYGARSLDRTRGRGSGSVNVDGAGAIVGTAGDRDPIAPVVPMGNPTRTPEPIAREAGDAAVLPASSRSSAP